MPPFHPGARPNAATQAHQANAAIDAQLLSTKPAAHPSAAGLPALYPCRSATAPVLRHRALSPEDKHTSLRPYPAHFWREKGNRLQPDSGGPNVPAKSASPTAAARRPVSQARRALECGERWPCPRWPTRAIAEYVDHLYLQNAAIARG